MQALYGLSFIVYFTVVISDWVYLYFLLRGYIATFPLRTWTAVAFVSSVVVATMLVCLLIVLCIENAFAHPNEVTEFSAGCAVINESFTQWLQAFNNFRISFLFMVFRDLPITILNFFYISPCRCAGPQVKHWPIALICCATLVSVHWRLLLLYFAYRRMICPMKKSDSATSVLPNKSMLEQIKSNFDKSNARLDEYDECWPVRFAFNFIYRNSSQKVHCNGNVMGQKDRKTAKLNMRIILRKVWGWTKQLFSVLLCIVFTLLLYLVYALTLCFPCCYHYGIQPASSSSRHKCAQSFVKYFSQIFHFTMFVISLGSVLSLIFFNATLLFSAHAVGNNPIPYEIKQLCVGINISSRTIGARFESRSLDGEGGPSFMYRCKPIWDDGGFELGFRRREAGPWQTRVELSEQELLIISTMVSMNYSDRDSPRHSVYYDFALLKKLDPLLTESILCYKDIFSKWKFSEEIEIPQWPYFEACENTWTLHKQTLIRCLKTTSENQMYL
ncbi:unnamed protein product [Enterobius vermicularis]|uniref:Lipase_3 domain-containing protein n=1 Tax=Enterobius vermicularis TaxID=51028 RepID=A0A0N4VM49_ENTVE|nr:unnamed protein product [Enterobius vermicularis]